METKFKIDDTVSRIAVDYTAGRKGRVVEIQRREVSNQEPRYRVRWLESILGEPLRKKLRTWVTESGLEAGKLKGSYPKE